MKCWSCAAENDLGATQTCARCGAPLARPGGVFRKPVVLGVAAGLLLLYGFWIFWMLVLRGCF